MDALEASDAQAPGTAKIGKLANWPYQFLTSVGPYATVAE